MPLYVFDFRENSGNGGRCHWVILFKVCADSILNCLPRDTASGHLMRILSGVDSSSLQSLCSPGWLGVMPLWSTGTLLRLTHALMQRGLGSALLLPWFPATTVRDASLEPPISLAAWPGLC